MRSTLDVGRIGSGKDQHVRLRSRVEQFGKKEGKYIGSNLYIYTAIGINAGVYKFYLVFSF